MTRAPATRTLLIAWVAFLLPSLVVAHPANIPVARAKVQVDGKIELSITFDILAFVLDQTPQIVLDAPMYSLLDGPREDLQHRLDAAKQRFVEGLSIGGDERDGVIDSVEFPSSEDIHRFVAGSQGPRLPVMESITIRCHLKTGVGKVSFRFPEVLGTMVLSTEFPYHEPVTEAVEPGDWSQVLQLPTQAEVDRLAAAMGPHRLTPSPMVQERSERRARLAIQKQYDAWSKAYMGHDLNTLFGILAPTYTIKTAKGVMITHDEYELMLKMRKQKHSDTTKYRTEIVRITLKGGVAAVWSRETTTDPGLNQKTGKADKISYQHDYIDLWIVAQGKWQLKSTVTQKEQIVPSPILKN